MGIHILYVEDSAGDAAMMRTALAEVAPDFTLTVQSEALQAISWLAKADRGEFDLPDLILTDIGLPVMSGLQLLWVLKDTQLWRPIPVLMFSASKRSEEREQSMRFGAAGYLVKPARYPELLALVRRLVDEVRSGALGRLSGDDDDSSSDSDRTKVLPVLR
ncbi:MAG: response regulator [Planctomycetes bacterium]|nr:response regulator [Planctomycetota bacterium]